MASESNVSSSYKRILRPTCQISRNFCASDVSRHFGWGTPFCVRFHLHEGETITSRLLPRNILFFAEFYVSSWCRSVNVLIFFSWRLRSRAFSFLSNLSIDLCRRLSTRRKDIFMFISSSFPTTLWYCSDF